MAHKVFRSFDSKTHLWPYIFGIRMSILKIFIHLSKKNQSFASNGLSKDPCQFFSPIKWRCGCAVQNIQYPMGSRDKFPIPVSRISMMKANFSVGSWLVSCCIIPVGVAITNKGGFKNPDGSINLSLNVL